MIDTAAVWGRADAAIRGQRRAEALVHLRQLVEVVDRIDFEYEEWLRALVECLKGVGSWREAAAGAAYLGSTETPPPEVLREQVKLAREGDPAAIRGIRLYGIYLSRAGHHAPAAAWFRAGGMPVHQAIELERAGQDAAAADLWQQLIAGDRLVDRPYELALARINLGLSLLRSRDDRARGALAEATTAVEEVADAFETDGLRERAFDCYQLLARLGSEAGAYENVAEGYLNSIRILRDDGLRLDALRLYEALVSLSRRAGEWHAAAGILGEAADFCTRSALPYAADLRLRSAEAWLKAAAEAQGAGHPVQLVENSYLAAAEGFASVRAFRQVAEVYRRLGALDLPGKGRERYLRLVERLGDDPQDGPRPVPVPEFLKQLPEYEEVWYVDLAEWELDGDPTLVAAGIMADRRFPDFVRRHALLLVLECERRGEAMVDIDIVRRLEDVRAYPVIAVLEKTFGRPEPELREAVARAMSSLRFKRIFTLLSAALRDEVLEVRESAAAAVTKLVFPHAFEPLRRLFGARDLPDGARVRANVIDAIGKIGTVEALDFLTERLHDADPDHVREAAKALRELGNPELLPYLRQQLEFVPAAHRHALEDSVRRLERRLR